MLFDYVEKAAGGFSPWNFNVAFLEITTSSFVDFVSSVPVNTASLSQHTAIMCLHFSYYADIQQCDISAVCSATVLYWTVQ